MSSTTDAHLFPLYKPHTAVFRHVPKLLQKVAISFQMPACLSIHPSFYPHWTIQLPLSRFMWNFVLNIFNKIFQPNSSLLQTGQTDTLNEDLCEFKLIYICERSTWTTMYCHLRDKYSTARDLHYTELKEWFVSLLWLWIHDKSSPHIVTILELSINHCKPGPKITKNTSGFWYVKCGEAHLK
jgi:hypothetical protein